MARYHYFLHRYGESSGPFATFGSRKALSNCMKALPYSPFELADKFFLHVMCPHSSVVYDFVSRDGVHLVAVPSHRVNF